MSPRFESAQERREASEAYGQMLREVRRLAEGLSADRIMELRTEACAAFWPAWEARKERDPVEAVLDAARTLAEQLRRPGALQLDDQDLERRILAAVAEAQGTRPRRWLLPALILDDLGVGSIRAWEVIHPLIGRGLIEMNTRGHIRLGSVSNAGQQLPIEDASSDPGPGRVRDQSGTCLQSPEKPLRARSEPEIGGGRSEVARGALERVETLETARGGTDG